MIGAGQRLAGEHIRDNRALTSPQTVNLTGTGTTPVTFSTNSLSFNATVVGNTSTARTVTMTNQQNVALNNINVAASAGFVVATDSCSGATLAPAASCSVGVTFAPAAVGSITGALTFTDDTPNRTTHRDMRSDRPVRV